MLILRNIWARVFKGTTNRPPARKSVGGFYSKSPSRVVNCRIKQPAQNSTKSRIWGLARQSLFSALVVISVVITTSSKPGALSTQQEDTKESFSAKILLRINDSHCSQALYLPDGNHCNSSSLLNWNPHLQDGGTTAFEETPTGQDTVKDDFGNVITEEEILKEQKRMKGKIYRESILYSVFFGALAGAILSSPIQGNPTKGEFIRNVGIGVGAGLGIGIIVGSESAKNSREKAIERIKTRRRKTFSKEDL